MKQMENNQDPTKDRVNSDEKTKMPRVAFLVVYVFDDNTRPLFDIHLERLRRHTSIEFRIFAAAHKLTHENQKYVLANPEIEIINCEVLAKYSVRLEHSHWSDDTRQTRNVPRLHSLYVSPSGLFSSCRWLAGNTIRTA